MNLHELSQWTAIAFVTFMMVFCVYKYTKQNRDYKW